MGDSVGMYEDILAELARAADVLKNGGVVAFPTDTVYGLGARADNPAAVRRIFEIKERPLGQALPLLVSDAAQALSVAGDVSEVAQRLMVHFWPGALTLVMPCASWVPEVVTAGGSTIAVRVPAHLLTLHLIKAAGGPLIGTSANVHGRPSPVTAEEVWEQLGGRVDLVVNGGHTPDGVESTIVDVTVDPPRILRQGMITSEDIKSIIEG